MKAVILAGGQGTRLSEETHLKPKPMVEVGGRPMLWHILKIYAAHGIHEFVICLGYKGYLVKEYFANYFLHTSDVTFDLAKNAMTVHEHHAEPWKVTLVDTGEASMTGGRLKRVADYLDDETFCFTYGDGVGDVDITASIAFHRAQGKLATITAVQPPGRFGLLQIEGDAATGLHEKPKGDGGWVNGGFFVLEPAVLETIASDAIIWERQPLETLSGSGQLAAYKHAGFWHAMDTLRDRNYLEALWDENRAPWKIW